MLYYEPIDVAGGARDTFFSNDAFKCAKCLETCSPGVAYCGPHNRECLTATMGDASEHLHLKCFRCRYVMLIACADAKEA